MLLFIALVMCLSMDWEALKGWFHVFLLLCTLVSAMWWPIPVHFMVSGINPSGRLGVLPYRVLEVVSPVIFMKLLWIDRPFLIRRGTSDCHTIIDF